MKNMKRILILLIVAITTVASANAQFRWGIEAGMLVNKLHFGEDAIEKALKPDNSYGWKAGVRVEFTVPIIGIGVESGLQYARMNNGEDNKILVPDGENITNLREESAISKNFLMLPIHLKYKLTLPVIEKFVKPFIFTGPNLAFSLDKNTFKYLKNKTCQVAWDLGLGVELVNHLQIGASYSWGMNKIANWSGLVSAQDLNIKNNYWTLSAAYLF